MKTLRLNIKEPVHKHCALTGKFISIVVLVKNSELVLHVYWDGTRDKWMIEARFLIVRKKLQISIREEARNPVILH